MNLVLVHTLFKQECQQVERKQLSLEQGKDLTTNKHSHLVLAPIIATLRNKGLALNSEEDRKQQRCLMVQAQEHMIVLLKQ